MPNYANSKVYKIINPDTDDEYYGATTRTLAQRMALHRQKAKLEPDRPLYQLMNEIGIEKFKIILVESIECKNKEELYAKEQEYIMNEKPSLNNNWAIGEDLNKAKAQNERSLKKRSYRVDCECGGHYKQCYKFHHDKTEMHQAYLESLKN